MSTSRFKGWAAYAKGFRLASSIFRLTATFPKEENYSLTNQIRRSSRSVCANLAEGYGKRRYPKHFRAKVTDAASENFELQTWLDFALSCNYISKKDHGLYTKAAEEVGKLLTYMEQNPQKFTAKPWDD
ncbi:MAG: four helix bundle protein [Neolewinella sp.]|jgi:four helix bundle protein